MRFVCVCGWTANETVVESSTIPRAYKRRGHATVHEQKLNGRRNVTEKYSNIRFLLNRVLCKVHAGNR